MSQIVISNKEKMGMRNAPDFLKANPFSYQTETGILGHMNKDHASALRHYVRKLKEEQVAEDATVTMVGIDGEGFQLRWEDRMLRFEFDAPIATTAEARNALIRMGTGCRSSGEEINKA